MNVGWEQLCVISIHGIHTHVDVEIVSDKGESYIRSIDYIWGMIDDDIAHYELATIEEVAEKLDLAVKQ